MGCMGLGWISDCEQYRLLFIVYCITTLSLQPFQEIGIQQS